MAITSGAHYDALFDQKWPILTAAELRADYEQYVGEKVFLFGNVESIYQSANRATVEVEVAAHDGTFTPTLEGIHDVVEARAEL